MTVRTWFRGMRTTPAGFDLARDLAGDGDRLHLTAYGVTAVRDLRAYESDARRVALVKKIMNEALNAYDAGFSRL